MWHDSYYIFWFSTISNKSLHPYGAALEIHCFELDLSLQGEQLKSKEIRRILVSLYASVPWCTRYIFGLPFVSLHSTPAAVWVDLCLRLPVSLRGAKGLLDQVDVLRGCLWKQDICLWAAGFCVPIWNTCFKLIYSTIWGNNFQPKHLINSESE